MQGQHQHSQCPLFSAGLSVLSLLSRKNCFIERRFHSELVYQYHPLFREFLLNRARDSFPGKEIIRT